MLWTHKCLSLCICLMLVFFDFDGFLFYYFFSSFLFSSGFYIFIVFIRNFRLVWCCCVLCDEFQGLMRKKMLFYVTINSSISLTVWPVNWKFYKCIEYITLTASVHLFPPQMLVCWLTICFHFCLFFGWGFLFSLLLLQFDGLARLFTSKYWIKKRYAQAYEYIIHIYRWPKH